MKTKYSELIEAIGKLKRLPVIVIVLVLIIGAGNLAAQEQHITLKKAIEIALKKNPDLKQVANQVRLNKISVIQKKTNFFPELRLSSSLAQQYFKSEVLGTTDYEGDSSRSLNFSATTTLNLFNGFYDTASLEQSKFELESAVGSLSRYRQSIVNQTMQQYIQVVLSKEYVNVEKENLAAQELQLEMIQAFFDAGRRPIADLYQQKAEISKSQYQLLEAERNYNVNKLYLLQTLGLEPNGNYEVADLEIDRLVANLNAPSTTEILPSALSVRPDLEAQELQVLAAQKGVKMAQAGYWPKLSLSAEVASNYSNRNEFANFSNQFFDNNINATVGLSLSIPIFDKGATKASTATARINVKNQEIELDKLKKQVSVEVQQAIKDFETAGRQVNVAESQVSYTKAALESIEARYKVQAATMVELTQARASYLEATYEQAKAKYNLLAQAVAVAYYSGDFKTMLSIIKM